jgi:hypothetical protein
LSARRAVFAIARADFIERVRRYSFLVTLLTAVFLGYAAATGKIALKLGDYRGVYTSGWIGAMVALVTTTFASLIGFYIVKDSVERDRRTGVGEVLATTPLSKPAYAIGKFLSNVAVLTSIVLVLTVAAVVMLLFYREDPRLDLWALLSPFLLIAFPAMCITAALALLFEMLPGLRGSFGNVVWFFAWSFGLALPAITGNRWLDPGGLWTVTDSMSAAARGVIPDYDGRFSLTIGDPTAAVLVENLRWPGLQWTSAEILIRIGWIGAAVALALLAASSFDRFDPSRSRRVSARPQPPAAIPDADDSREEALPAAAAYPTLLIPPQRAGAGRMFFAELRLALNGLPWWWHVVAAGLVAGQLFAPLAIARGPLLAAAWVWPLFVWSAIGARESQHGTRALVFSSPHVLARQFPMSFLTGVAVAAIAGAGVAVRLLLAADLKGLAGWVAGVLLISSLALALGVWTGTNKTYEAIYTVLWYLGPVNHVPALDFTGASPGSGSPAFMAIYLVIALVLLIGAFLTRGAQLYRA